MHRHGYQGRKLSRQTDQRRALIRGQVTSLVLHEAITTTEPKAREIAPHFERLVTKAKQNDLAGQRAVRAVLTSDNAAQKLMLELAPAFAGRNGGYTRIVKLPNRKGDNAPMAQVSLVLDKLAPAEAAVAPKAAKAPKTPVAAEETK
jgi:large subunit ribosomal protein L17